MREAADGDLQTILAIYNEVIATSTAVYALEPATIEERRVWFASRRTGGFPVIVAVNTGSGDILGFASFGDWRGAWPGYRYTVEHTVHVRHDVRGQGVGSMLVEALLPRAIALSSGRGRARGNPARAARPRLRSSSAPRRAGTAPRRARASARGSRAS